MAVKRKNQKKALKLAIDNAVRIRCCYCDIKDTCKSRERKEANEKAGMMTKCMLTPNRPKSARKKKSKSFIKGRV